MLYLLSTLQEVMTYDNVVKYIGKKDESDLTLDKNQEYVLFQGCPVPDEGDEPAYTYYCAIDGDCPTTDIATRSECVTVANATYALPVDEGYVVVFTDVIKANKFVKANGGKDYYEVGELVLAGKLSEEGKTAMQVIYCIMFWIIFALVIATFVLALLSIVHCGCCRCCNFGNSIFPTRQA